MKVINKTKTTTLAEKVILAKSIKEQTIGLLRYKIPSAMLIKTRFGIHTFFMQYPIDVLVLNDANCVVKLKQNMRPNALLFWNPQHGTVLELPSGTITKSQTTVNDQIVFG